MECQAVGTNEDTIAQINERVVLTTAGIAQLKELCDKMEQATRRVVWGICGELGKKGVADFASEQLKTGVDMTKPQPSSEFCYLKTLDWVAEFSKKTNEVIQEAGYLGGLVDDFFTETDIEDVGVTEKRLALKLTEVITFCTSWLNRIGYFENERDELQRIVNEKNREHGYLEEASE
jgi:hypothetical protein